MVRSIMCRATLSISFWGYALETASYILNLVPTKKVSKIPFKMWKGKIPSLRHIKIWGYEVFVRREAQEKLEARSEKCLFVGVFFEREKIYKEDSGSKIDLEEIQESADEEPIVNTNTQQEVVTHVEPDDISLPIRKTSSRVNKPPQFYYGFHIDKDKINDSTLSELDEPANYKKMDVKTAFINVKLTEDVFMEKPKGFENAKPDVSFALSMMSRHQQNPGEGHWTAVKNILKYLRNTKDRFLVYSREEELRVNGYYDASWQTDKDDSRSQSGWVFLLNGGAVTWKSSKQDIVADFTCESRFDDAQTTAIEEGNEISRTVKAYGFSSFERESSSKTDDRIDKLADQISNLVEIVNKQVITPATVKVVEKSCVICGGAATGTYNQVSPPNRASNQMAPPGFATMQNNQNRYNQNQGQGSFFQNQASTSGTLPSNTIPNPKGEMKAVTTHSGLAYERPSIPTNSSPKKIVEQETEETTDKEQPNCRGSTAHIQPPVVSAPIPKPVEYAQDVLDFKYNSKSGNPTLVSNPSLSKETESEFYKEPIVKSSSPTLTPFGESDFLLEEIEDFLKDESIPIGNEDSYYDPEGDILYLEKLLNDDPSQLPSMDLKQVEETKAKSLIEEPLELELKELPSHLEYAFLEENNKLPMIIAKDLKDAEKESLLKVLKSHKRAIAWKITDIKGIDSRFCTHKILMEEDYKPLVQSQRRVNQKIHEVIKKKVIKLLDAGMIYSISDSPWVSPVHCVPKKGGMTIAANENNELIPTRLVTDGFSGYFQIPIDPQDQKKTTFTCPYGTFAYRRMPFGLSNAPGTFQMSMIAIFHNMIEKTMEVFMDDFLVFGDSFSLCLSNLDKMLKRCEDTNLVLNWEKCHFMCKEGIVLGHKISKSGIDVDRAKVDVIAKLPHPTTVKGVRSFLGIDFMGPFPSSRGNKYILVAVDYLSKWVEVKALLTNDARVVVKFLKSLFARFGTPGAIISDRGTHFCNDQFAKVMTKYRVTHRLATTYHPQTSGQVEVSNRGLKRILERAVGENCASWSDKLDDALWAFHIAFKTPIGCTPYKLVYVKSCHLPIELEHKAYWALKHANFDLKTAGDHWKLQLNELNELRDQAYENSLIYKERTKKLHDSKIKNRIFNIGDQVLLFNSHLKIFSGKLKTRWSGPFTITQVFPYGTVKLS
uniref:Reverse transcriptase domain-containing protein n=1 Tax=Tanacetum cinerariifolium TaxID=118510 RepID=A0A6L2NGQ8_TANCI|nr:reverse transcriptase domain-containing protein [Tanacetum cinerariifolium]